MSEVDVKQALLAAYTRLMRPLVRILLRNGVSFGEFAEVSKDIFVDVAARDFQVENKKTTQARIAILTGLTRKDVGQILRRGDGKWGLSTNLNRVMRILTGWHTDPDFTGPYGLPLELPYEDQWRSDFRELAKRYSGDMPPRAMLNELVRVGAVKENDNGWFRVLTRTYMPKADAPDSIDRLAKTVRSFIETVDHNRSEADQKLRLFERTVVADDGLKPEDLARFKEFIGHKGQLLLEEIDNWLNQLEKPDPARGDQVIKTGLGIYHFVDKSSEN